MTTLPSWATLVRANNPGPMTLEGTNTWVLHGDSGSVVVDPGPDDEEHLQAVLAHGPVVASLLTHRHADHSAGLRRFHELTQAPVLAADPEFAIDGELTPGTLELAGLSIEVILTPGHTSDSVSFVVDDAVLTGDSILGRGTSVVAWPDGDLADYLASLARLRDLGPMTVLPGHGPARDDVSAIAQSYMEHRIERLEQVKAALASGCETAHQVVTAVYADVDRSVWPAAELSVRAQFEYLRDRS